MFVFIVNVDDVFKLSSLSIEFKVCLLFILSEDYVSLKLELTSFGFPSSAVVN